MEVDKKSKYYKDTLLMEWYRYAKQSPDERGRLWYFLPHDATDIIETGGDFSMLKSHKICTDAMLAVMGITRARLAPIIKAFHLTGVPKQHGNKGRSQRIKEDDPRMPPIREHFSILLTLGEVRPTKLVSTLVDGRNSREARDDDPEEGNIYLPQSDGIHPCYYRYMEDVGYKCKPLHNGTLQIKPNDEDAHQDPYVCLQTYYSIWQRDYPQLKVSPASEYICDLCCKFANRHHYLAKHKTLAANAANINVDDELFRDDSDDSDTDDNTEADGKRQASKEPKQCTE